jgi:CheY-like chemotaxis protein
VPDALPYVLVVDDHEDSRMAMSMLLEADGLRVIAADGVTHAFDAIAAEMPAVIITDISMPHIDGWTFIERLKASEQTQMVPIVVLTAHAEDRAKVHALAKGATFFPKPFNARELLSETRYLVYGRRDLDRRAEPRE